MHYLHNITYEETDVAAKMTSEKKWYDTISWYAW